MQDFASKKSKSFPGRYLWTPTAEGGDLLLHPVPRSGGKTQMLNPIAYES